MNFDDVATTMSPEIYSRLKEAVELGRWPNGQSLKKEQRDLCLEALIKYEISQGMPEEQRIGYIEKRCKSEVTGTIPTVVIDDEASS